MEDIVKKARSARESAYAPYSNYRVGAAIETKDGGVFTGANVEFVNFSNTLHAEEAALSQAVLKGHREFETLAVSTKNGGTPCGMCLQSLTEFDGGSLTILVDDGETATEFQLSELFPQPFSKGDIR
ncbi:MAG: cytidine deaminase [Halobacteriales archaeon]